MMPKFDAVFVGLTTLDISGRPIDSIPAGGGVSFIDEIRINPSGTAAAAAMNAAKLGIGCSIAACLGLDENGRIVQGFFQRLGVDCSLLQWTDEVPTSSTILTIRPNGDRPALHCRGSSDHLFVADHQFDRVCDALFLHLSGTGLLKAMDKAQSARLLAHAKASGLTTTFDLIAPDDRTPGMLKDLLPHVDYFMPSFEEAAAISGRQDPAEAAAFFKAMGAGGCIFKWGDRGSYISVGERQFRLPAFKVEVSDTTGCGDSYCGGFIAGLAMGHNLEDACRLATATSALVATGLGSDAGVIDLEHTLAFMRTAEQRD